jgi:hypothetical protein
MINNYILTSSLVLLVAILITPPLPGSASSSINNTSGNERSNIALADLHIIQAIKDVMDNNSTGALDQLSRAEERLNNAQEQIALEQ